MSRFATDANPVDVGEIHALKCELAAESLRKSGSLRLRVTGWSMLPTILPGDMLWIEQARNQAVSEGDIVLCARDRRFAVHRVVAKGDKSGVMTRGDAMPQADPLVPHRALLGKVAFIERNGKCIIPGKKMSLRNRAIATAVQHSNLAARIVVGIHGMRQRTPMESSSARTVGASTALQPSAFHPSGPCQS